MTETKNKEKNITNQQTDKHADIIRQRKKKKNNSNVNKKSKKYD